MVISSQYAFDLLKFVLIRPNATAQTVMAVLFAGVINTGLNCEFVVPNALELAERCIC